MGNIGTSSCICGTTEVVFRLHLRGEEASYSARKRRKRVDVELACSIVVLWFGISGLDFVTGTDLRIWSMRSHAGGRRSTALDRCDSIDDNQPSGLAVIPRLLF